MLFNEDDYTVPQCKVLVGGSELKSSTYYIESVNVQVSATSRANSCDVTIVANYDNKNSCISDGLMKKIVAGKKVEIEMGYKTTSKVFMGYINAVSTSFSEGGVLVSFSCLDARGLLMGNITWQTYKNEKASQIIKKMLTPLRTYVKDVKVDVPLELDESYPMSKTSHVDDYQYICHIAKLTGCSFCMPNHVLKFAKNVFSTGSKQASYKWGKDLISFERNVELAEQLGSVKVSGNSAEDIKKFSAEAKPPSSGGKSGAQLNSGIKGKVHEVTNLTIKDQKQAKAYAESLMNEHAMKLCVGSARVLGNEKLTPGGKVEFKGLDPQVDGQYLVTAVAHSFSASGFLTNLSIAKTTV